jgi:hypothetical protein
MPRSVQSASAIRPILSEHGAHDGLAPLPVRQRGVTPASKRQCVLPEVCWCLDVCFISSLPVMQRPACMAWADKRPVQIVWAVSDTRPDHDVVDDACDCTAWPAPRVGPSTSNETDGREGCCRLQERHPNGLHRLGLRRNRLAEETDGPRRSTTTPLG